MKSKEAEKLLRDSGFSFRLGNGSHVIYQKGKVKIVVSRGVMDVSSGTRGKILKAVRMEEQKRVIEEELEKLVPGLEEGMDMYLCLKIILEELKRLKLKAGEGNESISDE